MKMKRPHRVPLSPATIASLFGRFGATVGDQLIDQTDALGNQASDELLYLSDSSIARADRQLTIDHFHHDGITDSNTQFTAEAYKNDELASIDDLYGSELDGRSRLKKYLEADYTQGTEAANFKPLQAGERHTKGMPI